MRTTTINGHPTIARRIPGNMDPTEAISLLETAFSELLSPRPWLSPTWWSRMGKSVRHIDGEFGATQSILTRRMEIIHDQTLDLEHARIPVNNLKTRISGGPKEMSIIIRAMDPPFGLYRPSVTKPTEPILRTVMDVLRILRWIQDHPDADVTLMTKGLAIMQSEERQADTVQIASPHSPIVLRGQGPDMTIRPGTDTLRCLDVDIEDVSGTIVVDISPTVVPQDAHPVDIISGIHQVERLMSDRA